MKRAVAALCLAALGVQAQNFGDIMSERVATGMQYADGIVWSRDGFLVFADAVSKVIYRLDPGKQPKPTDENANGAQGLAYDTLGRLWICEALNRRVVRLDRRGKTETVAENFQGKKFNSPNDVVVRKDGIAFFTDSAFGSQQEKRELDFNGIYRVGLKGEIDVVAKWTTRPNGIALSNDGKTLWVTDSDRRVVVAFDVDGKGGLSNQRDFIRGIKGVPGGLRADVNGRLYVAALGLAVYDRDGKLFHTFMPSEIVTNCAFGDPDFQTLYASARKAVYKIRVEVKGAVQY